MDIKAENNIRYIPFTSLYEKHKSEPYSCRRTPFHAGVYIYLVTTGSVYKYDRSTHIVFSVLFVFVLSRLVYPMLPVDLFCPSRGLAQLMIVFFFF